MFMKKYLIFCIPLLFSACAELINFSDSEKIKTSIQKEKEVADYFYPNFDKVSINFNVQEGAKKLTAISKNKICYINTGKISPAYYWKSRIGDFSYNWLVLHEMAHCWDDEFLTNYFKTKSAKDYRKAREVFADVLSLGALYLKDYNNLSGIKKLSYIKKDKGDNDVHDVRWSSQCLLKEIENSFDKNVLIDTAIKCANLYLINEVKDNK